MKTAFYLCGRKPCLLKNLRIRQKIHAGSRLFCSAKLRQESILQLDGGDSPFIVIVMHIAVAADFNVQIGG